MSFVSPVVLIATHRTSIGKRERKITMSDEKTRDDVHHGITAADVHYPVVAEGTGKTLDEAHGAKAKEVRNVS